MELIGKTAKLDFRMVDQTDDGGAGACRRARRRSRKSSKAARQRQAALSDREARRRLRRRPDRRAAGLRPAHQRADRQLPLQYRSARGASRRSTQENVGRPFAIVLDNEVISAPVIREPILGGTRPDFRQLHGARAPTISRSCCAPARCRRAHRRSRSARSAPASARIRSRRASSRPMSAPRSSSSSCS